MSSVVVTERDGAVRTIEADGSGALMDSLRDGGTGIEGTCGGAMSCGTCHVYISPEWMDRLPPASADEREMLQAISDFVEVRTTSRLSCQIAMRAELDGVALEIAPSV